MMRAYYNVNQYRNKKDEENLKLHTWKKISKITLLVKRHY